MSYTFCIEQAAGRGGLCLSLPLLHGLKPFSQCRLMQLACWDGLGTFKIRLASATCYHWHKSVSSRGDTVSAMSDQADFLARVPEGTPQGESRANSGLVGTAKTPSPRPNKKSGGKRSREAEKSPSEVAAKNNKASKSSQHWGSVSTQQSDAFHPGTSSNKGKSKASPKKTRSNALPYQGFRIPQIANSSPKGKGKGIMKAKEAAELNGQLEPAKVRNSVRFSDDTATTPNDDITNEGASNEAEHFPQASEPEGIQLTSDNTRESVPPSTNEDEESAPYVSVKKFSIADEAKVRKNRPLHFRLLVFCVSLLSVAFTLNECDSPSQEREFEEGLAPSFSFVSQRNKPYHRAYCTKVEFTQRQIPFHPKPTGDGNGYLYNSSCTSCYSQVFKISLAKEDLPRQKYTDVPMIVNGIAVRLGIAPEAARDTRGFGTSGNPRNGSLLVVIPPHFWERLDKALSDNESGFEFFTLFPPTSDVPDRTPVTMYAKRASEKAVMQSAQKGPKVKLPWISFQLSSGFMGLGSKACVATKVMLESLGFEIPSIPRIARDERGNYKNMLHVEFSDYSENATQIKWHKWSRFTRGMPIMCEGFTLHTPVRGFADGFLSKVLNAKKECFHPRDKYCTCEERKPNRTSAGPSTSAKEVDNRVTEELNAIQALYAKKQAASSEAALPNPQGEE
mmetsp:Transcript_19877/g.42933  ORF Transcript_19877/g.42933 Transcript_19877/m.42933 type:complete len:677 (+) Transcript_19877:247-2277(+)